jgi:hypothetical protein
LARNRLVPLQLLEDELVEALVADTGLKPDWARKLIAPMMRHLVSEYGGERLYIPKRREYEPEVVLAEFARTGNVEGTCAAFGISRRTLYRLLGESGG